jgi:ATP-dependent DNA ligase
MAISTGLILSRIARSTRHPAENGKRDANSASSALVRARVMADPSAVPPPRNSRFGSPLVFSRVHWVRPELVAEVKYLTWTADNLLRQVVYEGLREDEPAAEVRREVPYPLPELFTIDSLARTQSSKG